MDLKNIVWEEILEKAGISEWDNKPSAYARINPSDKKYEDYLHCSHCLIYARTDSTSFNEYGSKTIVLMQVRFDGQLGFPGGGTKPGETPVQGLNRELKEESGWVEKEGPVREEHHLSTHVDEERKMVLHFYAIEVTEEKIRQIEASTLQAPFYGGEVLGTCRVPLYTMSDNYHGFPSFLRNNFAGNSKIQLIEAVVNLKFLTPENVIKAIQSKPLAKKSQWNPEYFTQLS